MSERKATLYREAQDWQRWEMSSFDAPVPASKPAAEPPAPDPAILRKEIQRLREAAQASGHAEGYAAGHEQGLREGRETGMASGREEGYNTGMAAGLASGQEQARHESEQLRAMAQACAQSIASLEADMGQALISLSIRIAEQVLRSTLDAHPEKILDLLRDVLQVESGDDAILTLRIHPADLELARRYVQEEAGTRRCRLVPDPAIERGGCIAETALGSIDATLQTRWKRVTSALGHHAPATEAH